MNYIKSITDYSSHTQSAKVKTLAARVLQNVGIPANVWWDNEEAFLNFGDAHPSIRIHMNGNGQDREWMICVKTGTGRADWRWLEGAEKERLLKK